MLADAPGTGSLSLASVSVWFMFMDSLFEVSFKQPGSILH